jgi:hypothetical protein
MRDLSGAPWCVTAGALGQRVFQRKRSAATGVILGLVVVIPSPDERDGASYSVPKRIGDAAVAEPIF